MNRKLIIFSHSASHTTARYFERVARQSGWADVRYVSYERDLNAIDAQDVFLLVDPIEDWPFGLEKFPCLKVAYLIDVHLDYALRANLAAWCDVVCVAQRAYVERLRDDGLQHVYWLPLAADPELHFVPGLERNHDVSFVGKLGDIGSRRFRIVTEVLSQFYTNDYRRWHRPSEMGHVYSQSKIVFNASTNNDVNMRVFEGLISGALLVTDRVSDSSLNELFIEDTHFVGYSTAEEAVAKIQYYLAHPAERLEIAEAGQRAALADHTYAHRMERIEQVISSAEWRGSALVNGYSRRELGDSYAKVFVALRRPVAVLFVMARYGITMQFARSFLRRLGAWLNKRIPFMPNAIEARRSIKNRQ